MHERERKRALDVEERTLFEHTHIFFGGVGLPLRNINIVSVLALHLSEPPCA